MSLSEPSTMMDQIVTKHGKGVVVVVDIEEYERSRPKPAGFQGVPCLGTGICPARDRTRSNARAGSRPSIAVSYLLDTNVLSELRKAAPDAAVRGVVRLGRGGRALPQRLGVRGDPTGCRTTAGQGSPRGNGVR